MNAAIKTAVIVVVTASAVRLGFGLLRRSARRGGRRHRHHQPEGGRSPGARRQSARSASNAPAATLEVCMNAAVVTAALVVVIAIVTAAAPAQAAWGPCQYHYDPERPIERMTCKTSDGRSVVINNPTFDQCGRALRDARMRISEIGARLRLGMVTGQQYHARIEPYELVIGRILNDQGLCAPLPSKAFIVGVPAAEETMTFGECFSKYNNAAWASAMMEELFACHKAAGADESTLSSYRYSIVGNESVMERIKSGDWGCPKDSQYYFLIPSGQPWPPPVDCGSGAFLRCRYGCEFPARCSDYLSVYD